METIRKTLKPATIYTLKCAPSSTVNVTFSAVAADGTTAETWTLTPGQTKIWRCNHEHVDISSIGNPSYAIIPFTSGEESVIMPGGGSGGGITEEQVRAIAASIVSNNLYMEAESITATPAGDNEGACNWIQLAAGRVPVGRLTEVAIMCRTTVRPEMTTAARYLGVWEADEVGEMQLVGVSVNAVAQTRGVASRWEFEGAPLAGRLVRLAMLEGPGGDWSSRTGVIGTRVTTGITDGSLVAYADRYFTHLPELSLTAAARVPLFADREHVTDAVAHVAAAERATWGAKADASSLAAHTGNTAAHVTEADRRVLDRVAVEYGDVCVSGVLKTSDLSLATHGSECLFQLCVSSAAGPIMEPTIYFRAEGMETDNHLFVKDIWAHLQPGGEAHPTAADRERWDLLSQYLDPDDAAVVCRLMAHGATGEAVTAALYTSREESALEAASGLVRVAASAAGVTLRCPDGGDTVAVTLGAVELSSLAALLARKDELLALLPVTE